MKINTQRLYQTKHRYAIATEPIFLSKTPCKLYLSIKNPKDKKRSSLALYGKFDNKQSIFFLIIDRKKYIMFDHFPTNQKKKIHLTTPSLKQTTIKNPYHLHHFRPKKKTTHDHQIQNKQNPHQKKPKIQNMGMI